MNRVDKLDLIGAVWFEPGLTNWAWLEEWVQKDGMGQLDHQSYAQRQDEARHHVTHCYME